MAPGTKSMERSSLGMMVNRSKDRLVQENVVCARHVCCGVMRRAVIASCRGQIRHATGWVDRRRTEAMLQRTREGRTQRDNGIDAKSRKGARATCERRKRGREGCYRCNNMFGEGGEKERKKSRWLAVDWD